MLVQVEGFPMVAPEILFDGWAAQLLSMNVAVVPPQAPLGTVRVEIRDNGLSIARAEVAVVPAAPALFVAVNEDGSVNDSAHPAHRGSVLVLYGTGQGADAQPVSVRIGAYVCEVLYSGPVFGYPGLWQVNARIPSGFFVPGSLPLTVLVGSAVSPALTVTVD
jgi:uncharacterized protein (TIGR03437 family)